MGGCSKTLFSSAQYAMIALTDEQNVTSRQVATQWYRGRGRKRHTWKERGDRKRRTSWRLLKSIT
jgi:hypothetical protein